MPGLALRAPCAWPRVATGLRREPRPTSSPRSPTAVHARASGEARDPRLDTADLEAYTVHQLRFLCKSQRLKGYSKLRKYELVTFLAEFRGIYLDEEDAEAEAAEEAGAAEQAQKQEKKKKKERILPWQRGNANWESPEWFTSKFTFVLQQHPLGVHVDLFSEVYEETLGEPMPDMQELGFNQNNRLNFFRHGMKKHCRVNFRRMQVHPVMLEGMTEDEELLKGMLAERVRFNAGALTQQEMEVMFLATHYYTREYIELWDVRFLKRGKVLENFMEEYLHMHGMPFPYKHCGFTKPTQLIDAMADLLEIKKVNARHSRLTRVFPSAMMAESIWQRCAARRDAGERLTDESYEEEEDADDGDSDDDDDDDDDR